MHRSLQIKRAAYMRNVVMVVYYFTVDTCGLTHLAGCLQARERAWRIGQRRPVTVYRLITTGTIEEKIYHRQIYKQYITQRVLSGNARCGNRFLKSKDIRDLFVLGDEYANASNNVDPSNSGAQAPETAGIFQSLNSEINANDISRELEQGNTSVNINAAPSGMIARGGNQSDGQDDIIVDGNIIVKQETYAPSGEDAEEPDEGRDKGKEKDDAERDAKLDDARILKSLFEGGQLQSALAHDIIERGGDGEENTTEVRVVT